MLSIGKMVAGAEDYYLGIVAQGKEEYYTGTGEAPGKWMGRGTEALGLRGEVAPDDLRARLDQDLSFDAVSGHACSFVDVQPLVA